MCNKKLKTHERRYESQAEDIRIQLLIDDATHARYRDTGSSLASKTKDQVDFEYMSKLKNYFCLTSKIKRKR